MGNDVETEKILDHIRHSKGWLDKAAGEYNDGRLTEGNMTLNLARAELTVAWENAVRLKDDFLRFAARKRRRGTEGLRNAAAMAAGFALAALLFGYSPAARERIARVAGTDSKAPKLIVMTPETESASLQAFPAPGKDRKTTDAGRNAKGVSAPTAGEAAQPEQEARAAPAPRRTEPSGLAKSKPGTPAASPLESKSEKSAVRKDKLSSAPASIRAGDARPEVALSSIAPSDGLAEPTRTPPAAATVSESPSLAANLREGLESATNREIDGNFYLTRDAAEPPSANDELLGLRHVMERALTD